MKTRSMIFFCLALFHLLYLSCDKNDPVYPFPAEEFLAKGSYDGAYWPTITWRTCDPGEVGMDAGILMEVNSEIVDLLDKGYDIHSVVIVKDGYIVAEQYYSEDFTVDSLHPVYSCTKSVSSALIDVAIHKGYIVGVNEKILDYFPQYDLQNMSLEKENVSIHNLLTMSAGFDGMNGIIAMVRS